MNTHHEHTIFKGRWSIINSAHANYSILNSQEGRTARCQKVESEKEMTTSIHTRYTL